MTHEQRARRIRFWKECGLGLLLFIVLVVGPALGDLITRTAA